nr:MAG TPA: hypothetical protein [Caudoviricetes sp.]
MTKEFQEHFSKAATNAIKRLADHGDNSVLSKTYSNTLTYHYLTPIINEGEQKYYYQSIAYLDALVSERYPYDGIKVTCVVSKFLSLVMLSGVLREDIPLAVKLFKDVIGIYIHKFKTVVYGQTEDLQLSPVDSNVFDNFDMHTISLLLSQYHLLHAYEKEDSYPVDKVKALYALEKGAKSFIENTMLQISVEEMPSGEYVGAIKFIKKEG